MITPQEAYGFACKKLPSEYFVGTCIDYHGCWVFPYSSSKEPSSEYIFVDKEDGTIYPFDPMFDIMEFLNSKDVSNEIDFDKVMVHSLF